MTPADQAKANAMHCEAKKHAYRQTQDGVVVSFVLHPNEVPDGLATAPLGSRYVLALVQVDENELPVKQEEARATPDQEVPLSTRPDRAKREKMDWRDMQPAAQAALRCDQPAFQAFLREEYGQAYIDSTEQAAKYVRAFCAVKSRSELGTNHKARVIWKQLDDQFQAWRALERVGA